VEGGSRFRTAALVRGVLVRAGQHRRPDNVSQGIRNTYRSFLAGLAYPTFASLMRAHNDAEDFVPKMGAVGKVLATKDTGLKCMGYFVDLFSQLDAEDLLNFQPAWRPPDEKGVMRYLAPKTKVDGKDGFTFKPVSEPHSAKRGKLVILTPEDIGSASYAWSLPVSDRDRSLHGLYHDNKRGVYRFDKYGRDYPLDLTVELVAGGSVVRSYDIPNPGLRYD